MKSNIHKRLTQEDKFARKYYCYRARVNLLRFTKRFNRRKFRRMMKEATNE